MEFQHDKWDKKVFEYRTETSDRKRNKIFRELCSYYYPKFFSIKITYPQKYHDDMEQIYMIMVLKSIEQWKGINANGTPCHWASYAYVWVTQKVKHEIYEKHISRDRKYKLIDFCELESSNELYTDE